MPLKAHLKNQRLHNFYSMIHPHLTSTMSHPDYYLIYVPLFYSVCSIFQHIFSFCLPRSHLSPSHLFYELYQVSVAACHFFLSFRHDFSIDRFHVHSCQLINNSFVRNFNRFRSGLNFLNSLKKVGHVGLSHGCHVICEAVRWLAASPRLMIFFIKILRYAIILAVMGLYSDLMWK